MQSRPLVLVLYTIQQQLGELDALSRSLYSMQRELTRFTSEYYQRILPLCERLERVQSGEEESSEALALYSVSDEIPPSLVHERMKEMYRRLVKRYHPDNASILNTAEILDKVLRAYAEKNMDTLWRMDIEYACALKPDEDECFEYLQHTQREIVRMLECAKSEINALADLPLWQIQERVYEADSRGIDLLSEIAQRIEAKIAAAQQKQEVFVA